MNRLLACCCLIALVAPLGAAPPPRDVYLLGVGLNQAGEAGGWVRVGVAGGWKSTTAGAFHNGRLFTTDAAGRLWRTNPETGRRAQVGKPEFAATRHVFAAGDGLYTVEESGNLYRVDPKDGDWEQVGPDGGWKAARAGAVLNGKLYTAESDGTLQATDLATGKREQVAPHGFAAGRLLVASGDRLYLIESNGNLSRVDPAEGDQARLGTAGAWKRVLAGAVLNGKLYTAETDGTLRETDLGTGQREQIGGAEFGNTTFMAAGGVSLFTIEADGNLYRVSVTPSESLDAFNWCPEEVEKVFREQGPAFYHNLHARQVLGKQATHAGVMDGLAWLRKGVGKDDLVVMYVGCHGFIDPQQGWGFGTTDHTICWGREIKAELAKLPCPVLLLIETCTSGGFAESHPKDLPVPPNVTALCACSGKQTTDNQLDLAVAEALWGRADFNHDGVVDLDELTHYVRERYKEWWPNPKNGDGHETPVIVQAKSMPGSMPLTKPSPALAAVGHDGALWSALLEKQDGDRYRVHLLGWSSKPGPYFRTNAVSRDQICLPSEGPPLLVEQKGTWYPARLLRKEGEKFKVHYLGYNEDEVVTAKRIKYPFVGKP
jgi:hypothetical protein